MEEAKSIVLVKPRASHVTVPLGVASSMFPASRGSTTGSAARCAARCAAGFLGPDQSG